MRIYNGMNKQVDMPLANGQRLSIAAKSISGDFMPNNEFLSLLVTSFDYSEIALVVSGPFEISMCSQISSCVGFVVNSLEEAIARFADKTEEPKVVVENPAILKEETPVVPENVHIPVEEAPVEVSIPEPEVEVEEPEKDEVVEEEAPKAKKTRSKKA
jgi:hypothetical protein